MITYEKLTKSNYEQIINIKQILFPESKSNEDYEKYFDNSVKSNYYLIYKNKVPCGTIGWYDFDNNNINAFVGWFGILPEFQNQGIGTKSIKFIIDEVMSLNYNYLRVYTDKIVNSTSIKLYNKTFNIQEDYTYPDKLGKTKNFVIFTKFLKHKKLKWNNFPLNEDNNYNF